MSQEMKRANDYVATHAAEVNPAYRLRYHAMPPVGWINDPNGFIFFDGAYHLYCQFHPYDTVWGPMHWGHWRSEDLAHWVWQPVALAPDMPFDAGGCFSGHAVVRDGQLYVLYTGIAPQGDGRGSYQQQCLASSVDGIHFEKHAGNPVIGAGDLPQGASPLDFRDPKVVTVSGGYRAIMASQGETGGQLLAYASTDLLDWRLEGPFLSGIGDMLECPDYFTLDGNPVLIACVMNMPPVGLRYPNRQPVVYITGEERTDGSFAPEHMASVDYGLDFYAPQTALTPDGRRVMVGWMQSWGHIWPTHTLHHGWCGAMTMPRELSLCDGKLLQCPAREIEALRTNPVEYTPSSRVCGTTDTAAEIALIFTPGDARTMELRVKDAGDEYFAIRYDVPAQILTVDRSRGGHPMTADGAPEVAAHASAIVPLRAGLLSLRVFLDTCSVEVFAGDGEQTLTSLVFPREMGNGFTAFADGEDARFTVRTWTISV